MDDPVLIQTIRKGRASKPLIATGVPVIRRWAYLIGIGVTPDELAERITAAHKTKASSTSLRTARHLAWP
jgi:hypothetical protein